MLAPLATLLVPVPLLDLGNRTPVAWSWRPHSRRRRLRSASIVDLVVSKGRKPK